jgi:hypothetical protein
MSRDHSSLRRTRSNRWAWSAVVGLAIVVCSACVGSTNRLDNDTGDDDEDAYTGPPPDVGPLPDLVSSDAFSGDTQIKPAPGLWRVGADADSWETVQARGEPARHAPVEQINAAFDIEQTGFAFFLTDSSVYRLNLTPPQWQMPSDRSTLFPDLDGVTIAAAFSNERDSPDDEIVILGNDDGEWRLWRGNYNFDNSSFEGFSAADATAVDWAGDPAPSADDIRAAWRNNQDLRGWLDRVPSCDEANDAFNGYVSWMSASSLHVRDAFFCPDTFFSEAIGRLLANDNRPPAGAVGAAFQHRDSIYWIEQ